MSEFCRGSEQPFPHTPCEERDLGWWGWIALWIRGQALTQGEIKRRLCYPWEVATALSARGVTGRKCPSQTGALRPIFLGASGKGKERNKQLYGGNFEASK